MSGCGQDSLRASSSNAVWLFMIDSFLADLILLANSLAYEDIAWNSPLKKGVRGLYQAFLVY